MYVYVYVFVYMYIYIAWQQTMLRIKDPKRTIPFYEEHFGFKLIHKYQFPQWCVHYPSLIRPLSVPYPSLIHS
jgi:Glyoxalase/Bleomycin resistance protein/Dioxygenase superfamily